MEILKRIMFYDRANVLPGGTRWGFDPARMTPEGRKTVEENVRRWGLDMTIGRHYIESVCKPFGLTLKPELPRIAESVLIPDRPWEGLLNYASILYDAADGKYRLWYSSRIPAGLSLTHADGRPFGEKWGTLYAESADCLTWEKPPLPYILYGGQPTNILDVDIDSGAVFTDPHDPASGRFKAGSIRTDFGPGVDRAGQVRFTILASDDGFVWRELGIPPLYYFFDTQNTVAWDAALGKYVGYFRHHRMGRAVSRMETDDLSRMPQPTVLLRPDCEDMFDTDYYTNGFTVHPYDPEMRLLFSAMFHHGTDSLDIRMGVSSDGQSFEWVSREPVIGNTDAAGRYCPSVYAYPSLVPAGGEVGLLFVRNRRGHDDWSCEVYGEPADSRYNMAFWDADRLAGLHARETGEFWTPLAVPAGQLQVNYRTHGPKGCVRLELWKGNRPVEGYSLAECGPLAGDGHWVSCRWTGHDTVEAPEGTGCSLRVRLENAAIYGIRVVRD